MEVNYKQRQKQLAKEIESSPSCPTVSCSHFGLSWAINYLVRPSACGFLDESGLLISRVDRLFVPPQCL